MYKNIKYVITFCIKTVYYVLRYNDIKNDKKEYKAFTEFQI